MRRVMLPGTKNKEECGESVISVTMTGLEPSAFHLMAFSWSPAAGTEVTCTGKRDGGSGILSGVCSEVTKTLNAQNKSSGTTVDLLINNNSGEDTPKYVRMRDTQSRYSRKAHMKQPFFFSMP